jgi:hypothetical protein
MAEYQQYSEERGSLLLIMACSGTVSFIVVVWGLDTTATVCKYLSVNSEEKKRK